jgi:hypothetical protein
MAVGGNDEFRQRPARVKSAGGRNYSDVQTLPMTGREGSYLKLSLVRSTESLPMKVERQ